MNPFTTKTDLLVAAAAEVLNEAKTADPANLRSIIANHTKLLSAADKPEAKEFHRVAIANAKEKLRSLGEDLDEAKFKFNPSKHEVQVSDKRSGGKFSITVVDKATNSKVLHRMSHELPMADEGGSEYTAGARIRDAKRVLGEDVDLDEAVDFSKDSNFKKFDNLLLTAQTLLHSGSPLGHAIIAADKSNKAAVDKIAKTIIAASDLWADLANDIGGYIDEAVDLDEANIKTPQKFVDYARKIGSTPLFAELTYRNWKPRGLTDQQMMDLITKHGTEANKVVSPSGNVVKQPKGLVP